MTDDLKDPGRKKNAKQNKNNLSLIKVVMQEIFYMFVGNQIKIKVPESNI